MQCIARSSLQASSDNCGAEYPRVEMKGANRRIIFSSHQNETLESMAWSGRHSVIFRHFLQAPKLLPAFLNASQSLQSTPSTACKSCWVVKCPSRVCRIMAGPQFSTFQWASDHISMSSGLALQVRCSTAAKAPGSWSFSCSPAGLSDQ